MVQVTYTQEADGQRMVLTGHANYDSHGKDIVCAGVSAITYALLGYLRNLEEAETRLYSSVDEGETLIYWHGRSPAVCAAFEVSLIGLAQIGARYPRCVQVEEKGKE